MFLTNFDEAERPYYEAAAKITGIPLSFGQAKYRRGPDDLVIMKGHLSAHTNRTADKHDLSSVLFNTLRDLKEDRLQADTSLRLVFPHTPREDSAFYEAALTEFGAHHLIVEVDYGYGAVRIYLDQAASADAIQAIEKIVKRLREEKAAADALERERRERNWYRMRLTENDKRDFVIKCNDLYDPHQELDEIPDATWIDCLLRKMTPEDAVAEYGIKTVAHP